MQIKTTKIVALVAFDGSNELCDPAGAAVALARQGFEVAMMPEAFRARLDVPGDDHLEASKRVSGDPTEPSNSVPASSFAVADAVADEVNEIVSHSLATAMCAIQRKMTMSPNLMAPDI